MSKTKQVRVAFVVSQNDHPALYRWITAIPPRKTAQSVRKRLESAIKRADARKSQPTNRPRPARRAPLPERPSPAPIVQLLDQAELQDVSLEPVSEPQAKRDATDVINEMWETF